MIRHSRTHPVGQMVVQVVSFAAQVVVKVQEDISISLVFSSEYISLFAGTDLLVAVSESAIPADTNTIHLQDVAY